MPPSPRIRKHLIGPQARLRGLKMVPGCRPDDSRSPFSHLVAVPSLRRFGGTQTGSGTCPVLLLRKEDFSYRENKQLALPPVIRCQYLSLFVQEGDAVCTIPAETEVPESVGRKFQPRFAHPTLTPGAQIAAKLLCDHEASAPLLSTDPATMSGTYGRRPGLGDDDASTAGKVSTEVLRCLKSPEGTTTTAPKLMRSSIRRVIRLKRTSWDIGQRHGILVVAVNSTTTRTFFCLATLLTIF